MKACKRFFLFLNLFVLIAGCSLLQPRFANAQQSDPDAETLKQPAPIPYTNGLYRDLDQVPESIRKSAPFARALDQMMKRAGESGTFDFEARVRAFEQSQRDLQSAAIAQKSAGGSKGPLADAWTNIGLKGNGNLSPRVFSGGCITALAIDPNSTNTIYAGATSGGVWKTTDGGISWVALTDLSIPNLAVASIAIDPNNTHTIYVGTGNSYSSVDELTGSGVWKSTDAGGTWKRIGATNLTGSVVKILVDPSKPNVILASAYSGTRALFRSTDTGSTWTKVFPTSGTAAGFIWDVEPAATINGTTIMYFVEGNNVGGTSAECGVYKSVNDGQTWTKITSAALPAGSRIGRAGLAIPAASTNRVFVFMANSDGDTLGLYRSVDNGSTWSSIGIPGTIMNPSNQGAQGWYDLYIGVTKYSNSGHDTIYLGGVEGWVNYDDASGWVEYCGYQFDALAGGVHVDQHAIAFNPDDPNKVYVGSDGGVYYSQDAGNSWSYRSNTMVTNRIYHIGLDKNDSRSVWGGAQDQGTWQVTVGANPSARFKLGGDGFQPIVDPTNNSIVFGELPNGELFRSTNAFATQPADISVGDASASRNWDSPFKMGIANLGSISAHNILYTGHQLVYRSTDQGTSWSAFSPDFSGTGDFSFVVSAIGLSRNTEQIVYAGLNNGHIELTTNAGSSWNSKSTGLPGSRVTSIVTSSRDNNFVLASFYNYSGGARVMVSTNQGTNWSNASGVSGASLPAVGVGCVAVDSVNPLTTWYAATDNGIYYTTDAGSHWSIAGSGLGLAPCTDVEIHPNGTTIRVATFGRGIWEANTTTLPVELSSLTYNKTTRGTQLNWHTDSERGNSGFYVERSIDGVAFQDIEFVIGNGTSDVRHDYTALDTLHAPGTYLYQLKQVDNDGTVHYSNHVEVHYGNDQIIVYQNYPNPLLLGTGDARKKFGVDYSGVVPSVQTRFRYELPNDDVVSLRIYNAAGALVRSILSNTSQQAGEQDAFWDARDDEGQMVSSGAYFWVLESQHYGKFVNKLMLVHD